ncbi:MAG: c-type cytochrome [Siculibacillus sp.]
MHTIGNAKARRFGRVRASVVGAGLAIGAALPAGASEAEVARGHAIATAACAACHAIDATGASPKAEAPVFRELGRRYPVESLEEALAEGVVVGHPGMPQVKMEARDIAAFIAWLKSIQVK